ncbi:hypothetical protein SAMN04487948_104425 [Halogranum amylolyticum]|uniref:Yip1 domain-containing protein n=1 Tax=Halogranum amylolyticum TaxID=660520 RepID=A0A1H8S4G3_9EURY|nr:hypothetical protein SAMN04487948_104425 [Halogranum amylolyticum]
MSELSYLPHRLETDVTTWVENPRGGRERGPRGIVRAWAEVLVRPRRFFRNGVAPGDQAPGLVFGVLVALCYVGGLLWFTPERVLGTEFVPLLADSRAATSLLLLVAVTLFVAPATMHLLGALQTLLLIATVRERAGVSETVQTVAYAAAPCVLAGYPSPTLRLLCAAYGAVLLVVGLSVVHRTTLLRATVAGAVPATVLFGYGFGGVAAATTLLRTAGVL